MAGKSDQLILQAISSMESNINSRMDRVEAKMDAQDARLDSIDRTQIKQEVNIGEHIRRTDLNEEQVKMNKAESDAKIESLRKDQEPLKRHVVIVEGMLKGLGLIAMLVSMGAGIVKIIQFFHQ